MSNLLDVQNCFQRSNILVEKDPADADPKIAQKLHRSGVWHCALGQYFVESAKQTNVKRGSMLGSEDTNTSRVDSTSVPRRPSPRGSFKGRGCVLL